MATQTQIKKFIEEIGFCAQVAYKQLGKVLPSVCIGMACVECGYGTAGSVKWHSYLGHKVGSGKTATKYWGGKFFKAKTKEEYQVGTHTVITDAFRSFDSMQQCVLNFYELLNTKLYARVKAGDDYESQMKQIKACGYMTSSTEVASVIRIIKTYDLTRFDVVAQQDSQHTSKNPYTEPTKNVKKGDRGDGVRWVQYALKTWGATIVVDGIFGAKTDAAVRTYQQAQGLKVDGIVGKNPLASMKSIR